jgi:hypothetical protein
MNALQFDGNWPVIKNSLIRALAPNMLVTEEKLNNVYQAIKVGRMECWGGVRVQDNKGKVVCVFMTTFSHDTMVGVKSLFIYSITGFSHITDKMWAIGYKRMKTYAKSKGCEKITFISRDRRILDVANKLGAACDYHLIELEV